MGLVFGIIFGSYFLNAMSKATEATEWMGYISPFYYVDFNVGDPDYSVNLLGVMVLIFLGVGSVVYARFRYEVRDIDD